MNIKEELLYHVQNRKVKCIALYLSKSFNDEENPKFFLREDHDIPQLLAFLESINFEYDNGYGGQMLFGNIWYEDGTFSRRGEYDGSEWWEHIATPEFPIEVTNYMK